MVPSISIVIPALDEEKALPRLLASIRKQDFTSYEIIVADNRSQDGTAKVARSLGAKVVRGGMPGIGRNRGAARARGEFLFFLDADVKLPRNFLRDAYAEMQRRFIDLATCEIKPLSNLLIDRVLHRLLNVILRMGQHTRYPHAPGFCILISRRLFQRIGGFDERLRLAEDHDLVVRASQYRPLRVLDSVSLWVDVRRFRKEGRLSYVGKVIATELFRFFRGAIVDENAFTYEFGNFSKASTPSRLRRIEQMINRVDARYRALLRKAREERLQTFAERQLKIIGRFLWGGLIFFRRKPQE
jgi:glycosyltransferase involved in cell wall biosynthesis